MTATKTLNIRGTLLELKEPLVMGILNITPDSFYSGSRKQTEKEITERIETILAELTRIPTTTVESPVETRFMTGPIAKRVNGTMIANVKAGTNINCRICGKVFFRNFSTCDAAQTAAIAGNKDWE